MQILTFISALSFFFPLVAVHSQEAVGRPEFPDAVDALAATGLAKLAVYQATHDPDNKCTAKTAVQRKEWGNLSAAERKDYIKAVLCLQSKPPRSTPQQAPGARSRYDDFVITHINQTLTIHETTNFLSWHRYYVWIYEKALREECGYKGYQPYWNWGKYSSDPIHSPIFDGSDTSLSGNGVYFNHTGVVIPGAPPPYDVIPPDVGGGCVITGPFKNMSVNVGPVSPSIADVPVNPQPNGLGYNPRCLRRDVNRFSAAVTATNYTYSLITKPQNADIYWFQTDMQGKFAIGSWGVHAGGHFTIGGDPGGDFFSSPGDPAFWLHHGQIDRVWWIWQNQDLANRLTAISGTITFQNVPPSRNGTLDDIVELGLNAPPVRLGDLLNTMKGPRGEEFCYIYV